MVAPVVSVMLWSARIFPSNAVPVPSVAERADLEIDVVGLTAVDELNGGVARGDQRGTDLEIEASVRVALGVERECSRQRGPTSQNDRRPAVSVSPPRSVTGQVVGGRGRLARENTVGCDEIRVSL